MGKCSMKLLALWRALQLWYKLKLKFPKAVACLDLFLNMSWWAQFVLYLYFLMYLSLWDIMYLNCVEFCMRHNLSLHEMCMLKVFPGCLYSAASMCCHLHPWSQMFCPNWALSPALQTWHSSKLSLSLPGSCQPPQEKCCIWLLSSVQPS